MLSSGNTGSLLAEEGECVRQEHYWDELVLALPRLPETKMTSTAAYAAVAPKILSRVAAVKRLKPRAKSTMRLMTRGSRASGFVTKYGVRIEPMSKMAAMTVLSVETTQTRRRSSKYLADLKLSRRRVLGYYRYVLPSNSLKCYAYACGHRPVVSQGRRQQISRSRRLQSDPVRSFFEEISFIAI